MKNIRKEAFGALPDLKDYDELINLVNKYPSHSFLSRSGALLTYAYLTNYVASFSENYFKKSLGEIEILDWGAGKGHVSYLFKKKGAKRLISCDINESNEDSTFGQETPIIKKFGLNIIPLEHEFKLPFDDNKFDVVLSFGVLEHVSNEGESLKELNRILKPGGLFFCFNLPYYLSYTQRISHLLGNYYHDRLYTKKKVRELLIASNFELEDIWFRNLFPKNSIDLKTQYKMYERADQILSEYTPLKYLSTSLEFLASKKKLI